MMKYIALFLALLTIALPAQAQQVAGIAAVVNDEAISMNDVKDRMKLVMISSGLPNNEENRSRILPQILESLIEEQLKMQEAARNNIAVDEAEIEEGFATIAQQNKFEPAKFKEIMQKSGIPLNTLMRQIRAQLMWNKYIKDVLRSRVNVSDSDVAARVERLKGKIGQTEYLAAEIYLPIENAKQAAEVQKFASRMAAELQAKKAPFGAVAAQFSKAAGAEKGGSLGWVQQGQLPPNLDSVLVALEEGGVSDPIKTPSGIHILQLQKKRTLTEESIPPKDELINMIGFERLDRVQQKALMDLKSAAFIDRRL
jgi:peptidyl-prolyl cis-trans isomerase SurA